MAGRNHDEKRMELTEHLAELRTRLIHALLYLIVGAIVAYQFLTPLYSFMYRPLEKEIRRINAVHGNHEAVKQIQEAGLKIDPLHIPPPHNPPTADDILVLHRVIAWLASHPVNTTASSGQVFPGFADPFLVRLQLSIIFGFILVTPLIVYELAMFIAPALTPEERKPLRILIPISILLLMFGITIAYLTLFFAMRWFLSYLDDFPGATLLQNPHEYVLFFVKMMAAFGFAFQLPVVLMGGAYLNLVTSKGLIKHWRWGVVIAALGGVFTPSNDLISMALMSIPLLLLYFGSIFLVKIVEGIKARSKTRPS